MKGNEKKSSPVHGRKGFLRNEAYISIRWTVFSAVGVRAWNPEVSPIIRVLAGTTNRTGSGNPMHLMSSSDALNEPRA